MKLSAKVALRLSVLLMDSRLGFILGAALMASSSVNAITMESIAGLLIKPDQVKFACGTLRHTSPYNPERVKGYNNDFLNVQPVEGRFDMGAYTGSLDGLDDDNNDGTPDTLALAQWVSYQLKQSNGTEIDPVKPDALYEHLTVNRLINPGSPYSIKLRNAYNAQDEYEPISLVPVEHITPVGRQAACNTQFTFTNAPAREHISNKVWPDSNKLLLAFANKYKNIWITSGPIFPKALQYLGSSEEGKVAIPNAFFRLVIKETRNKRYNALVFVYPQDKTFYVKDRANESCIEDVLTNHSTKTISVNTFEKLTGFSIGKEIKKNLIGNPAVPQAMWEISNSDLSCWK